MSNPPASVRVRVPGSTSNCGPGFDTLGLALTIYNTIELECLAPGEDLDVLMPDNGRHEMATGAAAAFFHAVSRPALGRYRVRVTGDVPRSRGLGSSVTVRAGIVAALNHLHRSGLDRRDLAAIVSRLEGHPDNACAGVLGGLCVALGGPGGELQDVQRIEVDPALRFVAAAPALEIETIASRQRLPAALPLPQVVRNLASLAWFVALFAARDYRRLAGRLEDHVHEPTRLAAIPGARCAIEAGVAAGGITGWLSGSGSTVLCLAEEPAAEAVGQAMRAAFAEAGAPATVRVLAADNEGLRVMES